MGVSPPPWGWFATLRLNNSSQLCSIICNRLILFCIICNHLMLFYIIIWYYFTSSFDTILHQPAHNHTMHAYIATSCSFRVTYWLTHSLSDNDFVKPSLKPRKYQNVWMIFYFLTQVLAMPSWLPPLSTWYTTHNFWPTSSSTCLPLWRHSCHGHPVITLGTPLPVP